MGKAHLLIREYYEAFNDRRFDAAAELFTDDAVIEHLPAGVKRTGPAGYVESARATMTAYPDLHLQIVHVEQRGDTIAEVDLTATFTAAGVSKTVRAREILEIRGGKITFASLSV